MFFKECKKIIMSIPYLLFVGITVLAFSQYVPSATYIGQPTAGENFWQYENTLGGEEDVIKEAAINRVILEMHNNYFITYPFGFYKSIRLSHEEKKKIISILAPLLESFTEQELDVYIKELNKQNELGSSENKPPQIDPNVSYQEFELAMQNIHKIVGRGSAYNPKSLISFSSRPATYEEALADYNNLIIKDRISGGYARIFADYMNVILFATPIFLVCALFIFDRRSKIRDLIWTRQRSSFAITITNFLALLVTSMIPILILAGSATVHLITLYPSASLNYASFFIYSFGWIMPSLMFTISLGMVLTEASDTLIAIPVIGALWLMQTYETLFISNLGANRFALIPRHNSIFSKGDLFYQYTPLLIQNRLFYTFLSLGLLAISIGILTLKRKGRWFSYDTVKTYFINNWKKH